MISATKWLDKVSVQCFMDDNVFASLVKKDIEEIQLDAVKEGMQKGRDVCLSNEMINQDRFDCAHAILVAVEKLTEKDL